jgi:hypothetical protein
MKIVIKTFLTVFLALVYSGSLVAKPVHHYVFFGMDREKLKDTKSFLETKTFEGAQVAYSWRQIEPGKDQYDFSLIREDLEFLTTHGKKLWIQLQDVTFSDRRIPVPRYLTEDPQFHGGADHQYKIVNDNEEHATTQGWAARRWDPAVQERLHKLLVALGKEFDGRIEGINLAESSVTFGHSRKFYPQGFTPEIYREAIIENMRALKRAFPKSVAMQYANFMSGGKRDLDLVYAAARKSHVAVGGPDLLPFRPFQHANSYPLIRGSAHRVPTGVAVQDGNYGDINPETGKPASITELVDFAIKFLKVDYIFWCTEEPYYSRDLVPLLRTRVRPKNLPIQ